MRMYYTSFSLRVYALPFYAEHWLWLLCHLDFGFGFVASARVRVRVTNPNGTEANAAGGSVSRRLGMDVDIMLAIAGPAQR